MKYFIEVVKTRLKGILIRLLQLKTVNLGKKKRFELIYSFLKDPWNMDSKKEQYRFLKTNLIISESMQHLDSILEIGCGEGHQSVYLSQLCDKLYGIDISQIAIKAAKRKCPTGIFEVADIINVDPKEQQYELVVACEILYYLKDIEKAIKLMSHLGRYCLVTYLESHESVFGRFIEPIEGVKYEVIHGSTANWKVAYWNQ
ncbi:MAG: class I SAM-dependent methyltransferase [Candidatus Marinimicrobia bacterium]|nr:class I SAM-dependent methyltransferase [Candidatus Neomarinimicrobiota bacterium]